MTNTIDSMSWLTRAHRAIQFLRSHGVRGPFILIRERLWFPGYAEAEQKPAVNDNEEERV